MDKQIYLIFDLLVPTLGDYRIASKQIKFNCPVCDEGGKYNLECNVEKKIFSCWSCRLGGSLRKLFTNYCNIDSWKSLDFFKKSLSSDLVVQVVDKEVYIPQDTVSYFRNEKAKNYLIKKRNIPSSTLKSRGVRYIYNGVYEHNIFYPFYKNGIIISGCIYNLKTGKYRNLSKLDFIPYVEFIDVNYPITLTEGVIDCFSSINSIPCLGTKINKEILEFLYNKNVILAFDNSFDFNLYIKILKQLEEANVKQIVIFDLEEYNDMNEYYKKDFEGYMNEYRRKYKILENG